MHSEQAYGLMKLKVIQLTKLKTFKSHLQETIPILKETMSTLDADTKAAMRCFLETQKHLFIIPYKNVISKS
jgi:hypothetical protein